MIKNLQNRKTVAQQPNGAVMVDELVNPYIAGAPVTEARMFFGREDVFDWIQNSLVGKYTDHILVIHGQRRVGKTSVLKQLGNRLPEGYIPVFFDLQGRTHTTLDRFLWWLAREIARVLKQDRGLEIPVPEKEAFTADLEYFENQFLSSVLPALNNGTLLLTFDEFDNLEEDEIKESLARPLVDHLRRLMGRDGINFIFSIGSSGRKLENMQATYTDFFKTALYRKISFLNEEQTHYLITRPVEGILEYDQTAINRIYTITGGHPYFTQLTCHELFARCQRTNQRIIREADVEAILDDVVERGTVNLKFVWDEASDIEKWGLSALAEINGKTDNHALANYLRKKHVRFSESDLTSGLLHLREKDVLTNNNRFVIHLLLLWLQKNRPLEQVREELTEANPIANRYIEIGLEFKDTGVYDKAIESFMAALDVSKDNVQAQVNIALVHLEQKSYDKAIVEFEKALTMDDEDVSARAGLCDAHLFLGDSALARGRTQDAVLSYQRVLEINAEHTDARGRMSEIARQRAKKALTEGRDEEALSAFAEALKFTPEDTALIARVEGFRAEKKAKILAILLASSEKEALVKNWDGAVRSLEEALAISPDDESISTKLADAKTAQAREGALSAVYADAQKAYSGKDYDQAVSLFKKIVLEDENYRDASRLLAQAIELRRSAPKWWQRKTPKATERTSLPRSSSRAGTKKLWLVGAVSVLVLGIIGGLLWFSKNGLPTVFAPTVDNKTPTASPAPTGTPDLRVLNPANQHLYLYVSTARTWHEARNYCALKGGYLATIQTAAENEFVYQLIGGRGGSWLGATDEAEEGVWSWVTREPWTYRNWVEGEPNNSMDVGDVHGENYMSFMWPEAPTYWNDVPAAITQPFVCEWGPAASVPDPDIHAKLYTIQNTAPIHQTNFDDWDFRELPQNAALGNGKLVLVSENQEHVGVDFGVLPSDNFAVEFEFRVSKSGPGSCFFGTDTGGDNNETIKALGIGFDPNSQTHLDHYVYPDQYPGIADGSYEELELNKVTLMVHGGTITVFVNGKLMFDVPNPDGNTIYSRHSFSAEGNNECEFDNYKFWDFREMDPAVKTAYAAISREEPLYQTSFDTWEFGNPVGNAGVEDGKLIMAGENQNGPNVVINNFSSDVFAVEFEFRSLEPGLEGSCNFSTGIDQKAWSESWKALFAQFNEGGALLARFIYPGLEDFVWENYEASSDNKVTLFILGDQITAFVNRQLIYTVQNPDGGTTFSQHALGVYGAHERYVCEFDNYKYWDLSGVDFSVTTTTTGTRSSFASILTSIDGKTPEYEDDFSNLASGWPTNLNSTGNEYGYQDGAYLISTANECNGVDLPTNEVFLDFVLEMDIRFINQEPGTASILFRHNDMAHYGANLSLQGWVGFHKNVNDVHIPLFDTEIPKSVSQEWDTQKHLTLIAQGNRMAIYINGELVIALADTSSSQGPFNFSVCNNNNGNLLQVLIDNLKIWDTANLSP